MAMDDRPLTAAPSSRLGGWKTFPFIAAAVVGVGIGSNAVLWNLAVYMIEQFNIPSIDATQTGNVALATTQITPLIGAILSDSGIGCFTVISAGCAASFLAMLLFTMIASVSSLRPLPCSISPCTSSPTTPQLALLYTAVALMAIGLGGTSYTGAAMGAVQLDTAAAQASFFGWYFVLSSVSTVLGQTAMVYVQENVGWVWGFSLCALLSVIGLIIFWLGKRHYRQSKPLKNPYMDFFRAIVATAKKRTAMMRGSSSSNLSYYTKLEAGVDNQQDTSHDGDYEFPNETKVGQVEEDDALSTLARLLPVMLVSIVIDISMGMEHSLLTLQALVMDRHIGSSFIVPVASMAVFGFFACACFIPIFNHVVAPAWQRVAGHHPTPLQTIGLGIIFNTLGLMSCAVVERTRLEALSISAAPMSVWWLMPYNVLVGVSQALISPGKIAFFYQEFPMSLKGTATGLLPLLSGIGHYLSTAVVELVRNVTGWLQEDANNSRLDNVYWMLTVMGMLNFGFFALCMRLYKKKNGVDI